MAEESKGIALASLGVVALIAAVGLVMLFKGVETTGNVAYTTGGAKLYGGGGLAHGPDQYQDPAGFVRDSTNRLYSGTLYGYQYGDDFRDRNKDSGDGMPYAVYDTDAKRTGPVLNNACPFPPYTSSVTEVKSQGRQCIPQGFNPATGEQQDVGPTTKEGQLCCV